MGIITLEDVIEELIGEEIVDETDMYVDVHKRIAAARAKQMYHQFYSTYASPSGAGSSSGVTSSATHDRNNSLGAGSADAVKRKRYGRKGNSHLVQTIKPLDSIPEDQVGQLVCIIWGPVLGVHYLGPRIGVYYRLCVWD